jgi:regulator of protease activity HflC (stomatin/prohibitin superfamily)
VFFEYDRGVVFRLGRALPQPKGPGLILIFWPIDWMVRVSLRTHVDDVPVQGRDHARQRVGAGQRCRVLARRRKCWSVSQTGAS